MNENKLFQIHEALLETRRQIKAAFERRVEVLNTIRHSPKQVGDSRPHPRETFGSDQASLQAPPQPTQAFTRCTP